MFWDAPTNVSFAISLHPLASFGRHHQNTTSFCRGRGPSNRGIQALSPSRLLVLIVVCSRGSRPQKKQHECTNNTSEQWSYGRCLGAGSPSSRHTGHRSSRALAQTARRVCISAIELRFRKYELQPVRVRPVCRKQTRKLTMYR